MYVIVFQSLFSDVYSIQKKKKKKKNHFVNTWSLPQDDAIDGHICIKMNSSLCVRVCWHEGQGRSHGELSIGSLGMRHCVIPNGHTPINNTHNNPCLRPLGGGGGL